MLSLKFFIAIKFKKCKIWTFGFEQFIKIINLENLKIEKNDKKSNTKTVKQQNLNLNKMEIKFTISL